MESISIPVPKGIAEAFKNADTAVKRKAEVYINAGSAIFLAERQPMHSFLR